MSRQDIQKLIDTQLRGQGNQTDCSGSLATVLTQILALTQDGQEKIVVDKERLIGEWVEDSVSYDLFRKVVNFGELPNNGTKTLEHGIGNRVRFTNVYGSAYGKTVAGNNFFLPFVNADASKAIYIAAGNKNITITTNSDRSNMNAYVYLEFIRERV